MRSVGIERWALRTSARDSVDNESEKIGRVSLLNIKNSEIFPPLAPMQAILDRVWEGNALASEYAPAGLSNYY